MNKYYYSVIRFVPSSIRGEFVNLGLILGCDETGEWTIEVVSSRSRAKKIDDQGVFPQVAADLQRLQFDVENFADPEILISTCDVSLEWLKRLSRDSQNLLQFSTPLPILADSIKSALEKLWRLLIVEPTKAENASLTKRGVLAQYWAALEQTQLTRNNLKKNVSLETPKTHTSVDVVVHNGVVKDITQCWSLQVKDSQRIMDDIKAWGWTMKTLRDHGGTIRTDAKTLNVPCDVQLGIVFAPSDDKAVSEEAVEVFKDTDVNASVHTLEEVVKYAASVAQLLESEYPS